MSRKKNKKSFSDNLELLFQERMLDDNAQDNLSMIESEDDSKKTTKKGKGTTAVASKTILKNKVKKKGKTSRKSFSSNLEQFFKDSVSGVLDGVVTDGIITDVKRTMVGKGKKRAIGLDLLIKRTTEANIQEDKTTSSKSTTTKRVTVLLKTEKLEELKRIAKEEKRRLHQIIDELVSKYLDEQ